jgi:hypothetical protein
MAATRTGARRALFGGMANFDSKIRLLVNPTLARQLDPRGLAILRKTPYGDGLLAIASVCDDPDCGCPEVQVCVIGVSRELMAVDLDPSGRIELWLYSGPGARPQQDSMAELYALVDVESGDVFPHPAYAVDEEAQRLLEALISEMDAELLAYLRRRFREVRRRVEKRRRRRARRGRSCGADRTLN